MLFEVITKAKQMMRQSEWGTTVAQIKNNVFLSILKNFTKNFFIRKTFTENKVHREPS